MDTDTLRRLHYAAAIACGVFAALGDPAPTGASTVVPTIEVP